MYVDTHSPRRRPPPRPPKSQHLLNEEAELRSFKQAASRSSPVPYPKGKNPFGESSDEEESIENVAPPPPPTLPPPPQNISRIKAGANPFDEFVSEDESEGIKPSENLVVSEVHQRPLNEEGRPSAADFESGGEHDENKQIESVGVLVDSSSIPLDKHSPPPSHFDSLSLDDREEEEDLNVEKAPQELSTEKQVPLKHRKRPAPKPPVFGSTGVLSGDQSMRFSLQAVDGVSPSVPRKLSTSCENIHTKGPAPPQPVGYKREIRAEGFIKYPKLRREIEEVNCRLSQIDQEIATLNEKIEHVKDDTTKTSKYTKKRTKLMEKREAISDKHRQLANRLQEQVLEDRHADLEFELRNILAKQEHLRTEKEQKRSEELLKLLVEIVEDRDKLVEEQGPPENNQPPTYSSPQVIESKTNGHQLEDVVRSD
ncbi:hypothetical protein Aperf_G00000001129 [Anoplocephala perfoliata]